ncbi:MAG TPA: phosphoribosylamine--glycine ligase [Candidatus Sumerlaeota bacterium]|nr:phosphoribosylamine--glycine ligase [Candidatus Sumerlaeota bacterium]
MNILLIGSGGREHALAWRLKNSPSVEKLICPNGNPGISQVAATPQVVLRDHAAWVAFAKANGVDLVVVGPEAPLDAGIADAFRDASIPVFGPVQAGARIESSKAWAKELMESAQIPTARAKTFTNPADAKEFARQLGLPVVIKADGLAAGKGVTVALTRMEADAAIEENLVAHRFGKSSDSILVEEFMEGEEASVFGLCDGIDVYTLPAAQDHKRVNDNDEGPNTGGMGAYAPAPVYTRKMAEVVRARVLESLVGEFRRRGIDYRGVIFAGLMLTREGPRVIEYNCRFGDPETQVLMPLIEGDLGEILLACAQGRLKSLPDSMANHAEKAIKTRPLSATTVVMASGGYPGDYRTGIPIAGLDAAKGDPGAIIFHAGTARDSEGAVKTAGGRVLAVTAWDATLAKSRARAYELTRKISFDGSHFRTDIAARALKNQREEADDMTSTKKSPSSDAMKAVMDGADISAALEQFADAIYREFPSAEGLMLLGIRTRGAVLAERLQKILTKKYRAEIPTGTLDIAFYRDDLSRKKGSPVIHGSELPPNIDDANIVLIDDVLFTGRTIRAAMNEISDFGRPAKVRLAVLVDRGLREIPIQPDLCGRFLKTSPDESVRVLLKETDVEEKVVVIPKSVGSDP